MRSRTAVVGFAAAAALAALAGASLSLPARGADPPPWMRPGLTPAQRADALLAAMTPAEKTTMLHGVGDGGTGAYIGTIAGIPRLGVPEVRLQDGPAGVGAGMTGVTAFPAPLARAASWNLDTERLVARAIATEQARKGVDVVLAPTVNLVRVPQWGRAFESYGEDPRLTSEMAVANITATQRQGVMSVVKHFAAYNQEANRMSVSADVSERALHELYLPAFRAAVERAGVAGVMAAYNRINGTWATEHTPLLQTLKRTWRFGGFVVSDWSGTRSTEASANAGLDVEMPNGFFFGRALENAVVAGRVPPQRLDDMARRVLSQMFRFGLFDRARGGDATAPASTPQHVAVARAAAIDGTVLLKNDGAVLPLASPSSIAVIGRAGAAPKSVGCGSARVAGGPTVTPVQGLAARAGPGTAVRYEPGDDRARAAAAARAAEVAVVVVHDEGCEGTDRSSLTLPAAQDSLVDAVAAANPRTIVVLETQGPVLMPWAGRVPAIVQTWYAGEQAGSALAAVLFGDADPGGRLPLTFPADALHVPAVTPMQYPGMDERAAYLEELGVGYRHYDRAGFTPLFPFGHGLSYTSFTYRDLEVTARDGKAIVTFVVENTGPRSGTDVAQVYVGHPPSSGEPPRVLVAFQKVALAPGATTTVRVELDPAALAYWDPVGRDWRVAEGSYDVLVGRSSRDLPLRGSLAVTG